MNLITKITCLSLLTLSCSVNAKSFKSETHKFQDVIKTVEIQNKAHQKENVLIILDIDNNILTSATDIGSDVWYQWQRGKLDVKPTKEQKVACLFQDSIGLLYELGTMRLTEKDVPKIISNWQESNTVIALTSRSPLYRTATERELTRNNISFDVSSLKEKGMAESPVYREVIKRPSSYMKGVFMTTGQNKGDMIKYLLAKTNQTFDSIIFVDDTEKNITNVYNAFENDKNVDVYTIHYTKVEDDRVAKSGSVLTQKQANKMASDWTEINKTLHSVFPARVNNGQCLGK